MSETGIQTLAPLAAASWKACTPHLQVPRSSKVIEEDSDYSLFSVTLFRRVEDNFKSAARPKGFQVRSLFSCPIVGFWMCGSRHDQHLWRG